MDVTSRVGRMAFLESFRSLVAISSGISPTRSEKRPTLMGPDDRRKDFAADATRGSIVWRFYIMVEVVLILSRSFHP